MRSYWITKFQFFLKILSIISSVILNKELGVVSRLHRNIRLCVSVKLVEFCRRGSCDVNREYISG